MPKKSAQKKHNRHLKHFLYFCTSCSLIFLFLLISSNFKTILSPTKVLGESTEGKQQQLKDEEAYWQNFLSRNPDYIPGLIELSKIEEQLGKTREKQNLLLRARQLNPNLIITP